MAWLLLISGLLILTGGAHALVKGGAGLALRFGLTPLVIGLTVMAYGTSSPEVVVSAQAALRERPAIAIGNVIGSNLCNLALILGVCALVRPLTAVAAVIRREVPILIGVTVVAALVLIDGRLQPWEGVALLVGLVAYTWTTVQGARREAGGLADQEYAQELGPKPKLGLAIGLTIGGLALLVLGSDLFVRGAITIAQSFGLSEIVIGLTVVAVGTSLPELATSLVAAIKGETDVAIGNVVGSNMFNILGILGLVAVLGGGETGGLAVSDLVILLVVTIA
ncbi:MAG TPA: calcium/sodium antiporter, partial [Candidatus Synoicihabitans sp.]|nr:calcium/sodium antiporter [Candidatus Synoicihabitans sp.]